MAQNKRSSRLAWIVCFRTGTPMEETPQGKRKPKGEIKRARKRKGQREAGGSQGSQSCILSFLPLQATNSLEVLSVSKTAEVVWIAG
jgi:hypothetical protein